MKVGLKLVKFRVQHVPGANALTDYLGRELAHQSLADYIFLNLILRCLFRDDTLFYGARNLR